MKFDHDFIGAEAIKEMSKQPSAARSPWSGTPTTWATSTARC
ncbi:MAG: hypothetical protein WDN45_19295 [Caulobacteraceae bacterium]